MGRLPDWKMEDFLSQGGGMPAGCGIRAGKLMGQAPGSGPGEEGQEPQGLEEM